MSIPNQNHISNLIIRDGKNKEYKKLDEVISIIFQNNFPNFSEEEVWDFIEKNKKDIADILFDKENDSIEDAVKLNFDLSEEDGDFYIKFIDKPEIELLRKLQNDTPTNFEIFCKKILDKLGDNAVVSGGPYDGGIDFMTSGLIPANLGKVSTIGSKIFLFGQAKRYTDGNNVKEKDLREFIGAITNIIHDYKQSRKDKYGIYQPTILAYWTTSDFHQNAKNFARKFGIWYLNGVALCQLAIDLKVDNY